MKKAEKISDSELTIMRVLWEAGKALSITDIREAISRKNDWDESTVKTLVRRLHGKGVLKREKKSVFFYSPLVSQAEYNEHTTQALIDKLYHGSAKNLVASLVSGHKFDAEEIAELREMLGEADE